MKMSTALDIETIWRAYPELAELIVDAAKSPDAF
jgi:hypothetical protein